VICLLSALRFHEITTESPGSVWIAVEIHSRTPRIESLKVKVHYSSGAAYREGIETHTIAGVPVKIYSVEKPWPTVSSSETKSAPQLRWRP
jgi:predicted transcriptional regulator of viral defense system